MLTRDMMHGYQTRTGEFIVNNRSSALWLDMGLGKTVSTATACFDMMMEGEVGRTLIVAPKRVAQTTWPLELRNWDHLMDARFSVIKGNAKQRTAALLQKSDFHIISRDNLKWLTRMVGDQWPWDMVVLDESSSFKSSTSQRFEAMKAARPYYSRIVELSATPAPQGLIDLWSQFFLLDKGERLGSTFQSFKNRWFYSKQYAIEPRAHAKDEIYDRIDDITVHMAAEDYLDMPELIYNRIEVDMPADAMRKYKKFEKETIIELERTNVASLSDDDLNTLFESTPTVEIKAQNAATLTGKLLQFANGAAYFDTNRNFELIHDEKIEALKELVETHAGYPILVAFNFQSDLIRIKKAFPNAVVMDDEPETQVAWNEGKIPMLLTHPASSGHGLNLQRGSNVIVWFGLNWSLELYQQLIGRLYRQGQQQNCVIVHHIIARGTVDERLMKVVGVKEANQRDLLNYVKLAT